MSPGVQPLPGPLQAGDSQLSRGCSPSFWPPHPLLGPHQEMEEKVPKCDSLNGGGAEETQSPLNVSLINDSDFPSQRSLLLSARPPKTSFKFLLGDPSQLPGLPPTFPFFAMLVTGARVQARGAH